MLDLADCYAYDTGYKSTQCSNENKEKKYIWRLEASQPPEKNECLLVFFFFFLSFVFFFHYLEILGNSFNSVKVKRNSLSYEMLCKEVQKTVIDSLLFRNELISTRYCVC